MPSSFWSFMQNGQWSVRHDGQLVHAQALPQVGLVVHLRARVVVRSGSACEHTHLAPSKPGLAERLLERQVQVLRAGLGEHVAPLVAGRGDLLERLAGRHVHDVQRHVAGHLGQHDRPVRGLALERRRPGELWYFGSVSPRASACCTSTSMAMPFSACIMIIAPHSAAVCMARRIWPSSL